MKSHGARLGAWVRRRRGDLGLTQEEVVGRMGPEVDVSRLRRLETGRRVSIPDQPELDQLAAALGSTAAELLRAAGLLAADVAVGPPPPYPDGSDRARIVAALAELDDGQAVIVRDLVRAMVRYERARRRRRQRQVRKGVEGRPVGRGEDVVAKPAAGGPDGEVAAVQGAG